MFGGLLSFLPPLKCIGPNLSPAEFVEPCLPSPKLYFNAGGGGGISLLLGDFGFSPFSQIVGPSC